MKAHKILISELIQQSTGFMLQPRGQEFEFPDLFPKDEKKLSDDSKTLEETKKNHKKFLEKSNDRPGIPGWYSF
jgi:large subunit ribosomal protein L23